MNAPKLSTLLRYALTADALSSAATGVMLAVGAEVLAPYLGLPVTLLRPAGIVLLPFAALVGYLATRPAVGRPLLWTVIVINALWAVDSLLLLVSGWVEPSLLGIAFVVVQALAVAALAEVQYVGLRRLQVAA
ncbi:MAG TPA: hypothetical protein VF678_01545 [bacterium]